MNTKEVVKMLERWSVRYEQRMDVVNAGYERAALHLDKARQSYEDQKGKWYNSRFMYALSAAISLVLILVFLGLYIWFHPCPTPFTITYDKLAIVQQCAVSSKK